MEETIEGVNPKMPEVDIIYRILKMNNQALSFREILQQVCAIKGIPADNPQLMAEVHTQINLDSRFVFMGQGSWGLREWSQGKVVRRNISFAAAGRTIPFRHRSLQDEIESEGYDDNKLELSSVDEEDEWEE